MLLETDHLRAELAKLEATARLHPEDPFVLYHLGIAYYRLDMLREAEAMWELAYRQHPKDPFLADVLAALRRKERIDLMEMYRRHGSLQKRMPRPSSRRPPAAEAPPRHAHKHEHPKHEHPKHRTPHHIPTPPAVPEPETPEETAARKHREASTAFQEALVNLIFKTAVFILLTAVLFAILVKVLEDRIGFAGFPKSRKNEHFVIAERFEIEGRLQEALLEYEQALKELHGHKIAEIETLGRMIAIHKRLALSVDTPPSKVKVHCRQAILRSKALRELEPDSDTLAETYTWVGSICPDVLVSETLTP